MSEEQPWRQQLKDVRAFVETLKEPERDTTTIAGKFAEALGCLEDGLNWLHQVNEEYDPEDYADEIRLVVDYGLPPCNPVMDFWVQAEFAEDRVKDILNRLQRVENLAPKEETT